MDGESIKFHTWHMAKGRLEEICFGELRLIVITWNIANNDISSEDVDTLVRQSFAVSYWEILVSVRPWNSLLLQIKVFSNWPLTHALNNATGGHSLAA